MSADRTITRTGIEIGIAHQPPQKPYHDADAVRIQTALINCRGKIDWDGVVIVGGCALLILSPWIVAWVRAMS